MTTTVRLITLHHTTVKSILMLKVTIILSFVRKDDCDDFGIKRINR